MTQIPSTTKMTRAFLTCALLASVPPMIYLLFIAPVENWWSAVLVAPLASILAIWFLVVESLGPKEGAYLGYVIALVGAYSTFSALACAHLRGWRPWAFVTALVLGIVNAALLPHMIRTMIERLPPPAP